MPMTTGVKKKRIEMIGCPLGVRSWVQKKDFKKRKLEI